MRTFNRIFKYYCATGGVSCAVCVFLALTVSGLLPPPPPSWDAKQTVEYLRPLETRMKAGSVFFLLSSLFYVPQSVALADQLRRIPNLPWIASTLQAAAGASGQWTLVLSGASLATIAYRLDRPIEITQAFFDLFWFASLMSVTSYMIQWFAVTYAISFDQRPKSAIVKVILVINPLLIVLCIPIFFLHCVKSGPVAWNGVLGFWIPMLVWGILLVFEAVYVSLEMLRQEREEAAPPSSSQSDCERDRINVSDQLKA